ncbi:MAG: hypothetical protein HC831_28895 [Chloroflexia bacterium]|nr:hypothetical protein [Chloroflexia bacterium]
MLKKNKLSIIRNWYPNAITSIDGVNKVIDYFENELLLEPSQVMLADSICSDDVNCMQYPTRALEFLGPFKMGGLDGFPFAGLTGMGAFASHVPDNGAVFIYYGPHIGITKTGTIGEIHRLGQSKNSGCCGAAKGALSKLLNSQIIAGNISDIDYQMNTIEQILLNQQDRIVNASTPLYEATEVIYEAIDLRINELVEKTKYSCKYVVLMGAIHINSDSDIGSFTAIRRFDIIDLTTQERQNKLNYLKN